MICYLDTSALVKIYVVEEGSSLVKSKIDEAEIIATSKIAYPEARAAFARAWRQGILTEQAYREVIDNFNSDWPAYFSLELTDRVCYLAGTIAEKHSLRGFDSIHMASVKILGDLAASNRIEPLKSKGMSVIVGCWDKNLLAALQSERFITFPG